MSLDQVSSLRGLDHGLLKVSTVNMHELQNHGALSDSNVVDLHPPHLKFNAISSTYVHVLYQPSGRLMFSKRTSIVCPL